MIEHKKLQRKVIGRSAESSHTPLMASRSSFSPQPVTTFQTVAKSPATTQQSPDSPEQTSEKIAQDTQSICLGHDFSKIPILPKLTVSQSDDPYEREADAVAERVMQMPEPAIRASAAPIQGFLGHDFGKVSILPKFLTNHPEGAFFQQVVQRKCASCEAEEEETVQRMSDGTAHAQPGFESQLTDSKGKGNPLPNEVRSFMEPRFGVDFSQVNVHTDATAMQMNRELNAQAFTHKQDIYFSSGKSPSNDALTAHELTHVVQQTNSTQRKLTTNQLKHQRNQELDQTTNEENTGSSEPTIHLARQTSQIVEQQKYPASQDEDILMRSPESDNNPGSQVAPPEAGAQLPQPQSEVANSFSQLLEEWRDAGLLDPPFRPEDVPAIPSIPNAQAQTGDSEASGVVAGGAAPVLSPVPTGSAPWRPTVIPGGGGAPTSSPVPASGGMGGLARWLGPIGIFLTILLTPTPTAPPWMDELNPITHGSYRSPEEYEWVRRLNGPQIEYLQQLHAARNLEPDPAVDSESDPFATPQPLPAPAPDSQDEEVPCFSAPVPRLGGNPLANAYATKVTGTTLDYFVRTPQGLSINYDGLSPGTTNVWEAKRGYGWFHNPQKRSLTDRKLGEWDAQKNRGLAVATSCNYVHLWAVSERSVATLMNARWGGIPPVLHIPR